MVPVINNSTSYTSYLSTVESIASLNSSLEQRICSAMRSSLMNIYSIEPLEALQVNLRDTTQEQIELAKREFSNPFPGVSDTLLSPASISPSPLLPCPSPSEQTFSSSQNLLSRQPSLSPDHILTSSSQSSSVSSDLFSTGMSSMYSNSDSSSSSSSSSTSSKKRKKPENPEMMPPLPLSSSGIDSDDSLRCRQSGAELGIGLKKLKQEAEELTNQIEILKEIRKIRLGQYNRMVLELKNKNLLHYMDENLSILLTPEQVGVLKLKSVFEAYQQSLGL